MKRIITFHDPEKQDTGEFGAAFYVFEDCTPEALRIRAETAPGIEDATFDIYDDGVSIFRNTGSLVRNTSTGVITSNTTDTTIKLAKDSNSEDAAENFNDKVIEKGSWLTCELVSNGGNGKNFTLQLELEEL